MTGNSNLNPKVDANGELVIVHWLLNVLLESGSAVVLK